MCIGKPLRMDRGRQGWEGRHGVGRGRQVKNILYIYVCRECNGRHISSDQTFYLSNHLFTCLFIYFVTISIYILSIYLFVYIFCNNIYLSTGYPSIYLFVYIFCNNIYLSNHLYTCLFIYFVTISIYLLIYILVCFYIL